MDRQEVSADGEDVGMFAIEVHDAQDRVVPITDYVVTFNVSGSGKLIGVGNGDPTDHDSDKGTTRKAFAGLCMAIAQSTKTAGKLTVEATSPGLTSANVTIDVKSVTLRPQIAAWQREIPTGSGITGLWRPKAGGPAGLLGMLVGDGAMLFSLKQDGGNLDGNVEGGAGGFFGGADAPLPVTEGKADGNKAPSKPATAPTQGPSSGDRVEV